MRHGVNPVGSLLGPCKLSQARPWNFWPRIPYQYQLRYGEDFTKVSSCGREEIGTGIPELVRPEIMKMTWGRAKTMDPHDLKRSSLQLPASLLQLPRPSAQRHTEMELRRLFLKREFHGNLANLIF